jgi:hypothetical protein
VFRIRVQSTSSNPVKQPTHTHRQMHGGTAQDPPIGRIRREGTRQLSGKRNPPPQSPIASPPAPGAWAPPPGALRAAQPGIHALRGTQTRRVT